MIDGVWTTNENFIREKHSSTSLFAMETFLRVKVICSNDVDEDYWQKIHIKFLVLEERRK
ncbi:auxin response factor 17-like [Iris pallida]|uniref:Auxin response factor 17-like n=1 Tax=Iris pallida TaxID=29817 RepID=A0AAX6GMR6_IRIPA|nr:auxin response factor 17-like [Iris pallida]KAJ6843203.1 auxin response factor 17-like [Iris pallida]